MHHASDRDYHASRDGFHVLGDGFLTEFQWILEDTIGLVWNPQRILKDSIDPFKNP